MFDIVYRFDPSKPGTHPDPATAAAAVRVLEEGNDEFATLLEMEFRGEHPLPKVIPLDRQDLGITVDGKAPAQRPFAVVLGCSDARVPTELVFHQASNDLFVVRVAGNVLSEIGLGSIDYAVSNLDESVKLVVVLGHSNCGAVSAAVDAFIEPSNYMRIVTGQAIRSIIDKLFVNVRTAANALAAVWGDEAARKPGYRRALVECAVAVNAAMTAKMLVREFHEAVQQGLGVVYGAYDLETRRVRLWLEGQGADGSDEVVCLRKPPATPEELAELARRLAGSRHVRQLLDGPG